MAVKNWVYGAKTPDVSEAVEKAIRKAHEYRNKLCEIELEKRARHEALLQELSPDYVAACQQVAQAETRLGEVREAIQRERTKQRTKTPKGVGALTQEAKDLRATLKQLRSERKDAKKAAYSDGDVKAAMDANQAQYKEAASAAKKESGLYWGTEAIVRQASSSFSSGAPPKFRRYDGTGQLAVQLQGGLDCSIADSQNTLCYIGKSRGKLTECFIRIGSDGRSPVFARVPIVMHRPLPAGKIKWAYLERRKMADKPRWYIRLAIDCIDQDRKRDSDKWVALHVGWSAQRGGVRAAIWQGFDGQQGAIWLSKEHCADYAKLDAVRSDRDNGFNEQRDAVKEWAKSRDDLPEWFADAAKTMHVWRSPQRLAALVLRWRDERLDGDGEAFQAADRWRKWDKHRWQHFSRLSARVTRRRRDSYRKAIFALAQRYGVLLVGKIDSKSLAENTQPEALERDPTLAHRQAKWAAVSELIRFAEEKFPLTTVEVDCRNLTKQCGNCGHVHAGDITRRKVQCSECGSTWDIDENAIVNTIARGEAAIKSGVLLELEQRQRDKERKAAEKLAKMQAANRAARKQRKSNGSVLSK